MPYSHENRSFQGRGNRNQGRDRNFSNFSFDQPFFINNELNKVWVKEKAKELSESLAAQNFTTSALRNFFNEFIRIKNLSQKSDEEKKILVRLLSAKVNYKCTNNRIPRDFVIFIEKLINEINDDLSLFEKSCFIMEAIVGYNPRK